MSAKMVKFHLMSKRGETSKFDQNPWSRGAAKARTTSFKFSRSAKLRHSEGFKFSRAIKHELAQTAHLKSTPKWHAPYAAKSRCNEARCENTPPRHTQRTQKNSPKRCELQAIKILPQRRMENTVKFRYKDRYGEPKRYAQQAVNFINLADRGFRYEFKFSRAMSQAGVWARRVQQAAVAHEANSKSRAVSACAANVKILPKLCVSKPQFRLRAKIACLANRKFGVARRAR